MKGLILFFLNISAILLANKIWPKDKVNMSNYDIIMLFLLSLIAGKV